MDMNCYTAVLFPSPREAGEMEMEKLCSAKRANYSCTLTASESVLLQQVALLSGDSVSHSAQAAYVGVSSAAHSSPHSMAPLNDPHPELQLPHPNKKGCWEAEQLGFLVWFDLVWFFFFLNLNSGIWTEGALQPSCHFSTSTPESLENKWNTPKIKCQFLYWQMNSCALHCGAKQMWGLENTEPDSPLSAQWKDTRQRTQAAMRLTPLEIRNFLRKR